MRSWKLFLARLYVSLTAGGPPEPADVIVAIAGRPERKRYALELYRQAFALRLILSVARFEVSKMHALGLAGLEDLIALRDKTPPDERHFFVSVDAAGTHLAKARLRRWNTYGEVLGLRDLLEASKPGRVIFVSTDIHLRRIALVVRNVFRGSPIEFRYCPVPSHLQPLQRDGWWTRADERRFVLSEAIKLAAYRVILLSPPWLVGKLMRLKDGGG